MTARSKVLIAADVLVLAASAVGVVLTSRAADWHPAGLIATLFVFAVGSDFLAVSVQRNIRISGAFMAIVLTVVLAGPRRQRWWARRRRWWPTFARAPSCAAC